MSRDRHGPEAAELRRLLATDPRAAEAHAREILRESPADAGALLLLAAALRKQNALASARSVLEGLVGAQPQLPQAHYELGLVLGECGENRQAARALRAAVDLDPGFAAAWNALGDQMTRMQSRKGADAAYANAFYATVEDAALREALTALRANRLDEARGHLLDRLGNDPSDVNALKLLGEVEARARRPDRAEALFRRCAELAPDFAAARFRHATVLMSLNRPEEAIVQIDALLAREPDEPYSRGLKAAALIRMSAFAEAAAEYEILLAANPNRPGAWLSYGHALKAMGRRDEAVAAYRKAAALLPGLGEAYWGLANLKTYRFAAEEREAMRVQLARADIEGDNRAQIHFALGKALEDEGRFEDAFDNYARGNAIVRGLLPYDAEETSENLRRSEALFTPGFFAARAGEGCGEAGPVFVVGLPRSGSTLVEQILASHSAIEGTTELRAIPYLAGRLGGKRTPDDKAAHMPEALARLDRATREALGAEYLHRARVHRRTARPFFVDKRPDNFAHIGLIHLILPHARIIDVRRHPMACGWSNFAQHFGTGQAFSYGLGDIGRYYRDYAALMAHFDAVLPGRVHRVFYERLVENPEREIRAMLAHLGLPMEERCLRFHENGRVVRSASAEQVRRPIHSGALHHWRHFEPWLAPLKHALGGLADAYPAVPKSYGGVRAAIAAQWNDGGVQFGWNG